MAKLKKTASASKQRDMYRPHSRQLANIPPESKTKTDQAASTDVNNIIRKYDRTGLITHLREAEGVYADVSEIGSYQDAVNVVQAAEESFLALPPGLRTRFDNDPAQFVDWASSASQDERNALYGELTGLDRFNDAKSSEAPQTPPDGPPADP